MLGLWPRRLGRFGAASYGDGDETPGARRISSELPAAGHQSEAVRTSVFRRQKQTLKANKPQTPHVSKVASPYRRCRTVVSSSRSGTPLTTSWRCRRPSRTEKKKNGKPRSVP